MSDKQDETEEPMSDAQRDALVKALVRLLRDEERKDDRMKRLREGANKR